MSEATKTYWNERSDAYFAEGEIERDLAEIEADPSRAFPSGVWAMLRDAAPDFHGTRVLVPSAGDHLAAFAFSRLGASVVAADISERQIENARRIAKARGIPAEFRLADSQTLRGIESGAFDLAYTSNGTHVWIPDLGAMYRSIRRALRPGGTYAFFETHPFHRPFEGEGADFRIARSYSDLGGPPESITHRWRIEDFLRALIASGFAIEDFRELFSRPGEPMAYAWHYKTRAEREADGGAKYDWARNPSAALPSWIAVRVACKDGVR